MGEEKTIAGVVISICRINPDSEIIVVDDGSIDNPESNLRELSGLYSIKYERNYSLY